MIYGNLIYIDLKPGFWGRIIFWMIKYKLYEAVSILGILGIGSNFIY